jgi:hypothetical protein
MSATKRSGRCLGIRGLRPCLAVVLGCAIAGCSGGGAASVSSEAQAKAKENFKKRFGDYGVKPGRKSAR